LRSDHFFFRGSEFPRLAILALVMIGGWIAVYVLMSAPRRSQRPTLTAARITPLPPPDEGPEFQGLQDRRPLSLRDSAAYDTLLKRVRDLPYAELNRRSRRDVLFSQLIDNPRRYRGLPIHIDGTVLRVLRQDEPGSNLFPRGQYFEAYAITPDSVNFPWYLVFEEAPPNLQVGDDLRQHITFDGYFFKLLAYQAADTMRVAPVLVGRFPPAPEAGAARPEPGWSRDALWLALLMGVLTAYIGIRVFFQLRQARTRTARARPTGHVEDRIDPETLARWIEEAPEEPGDDTIDRTVT
jgi:hypothetical protein